MRRAARSLAPLSALLWQALGLGLCSAGLVAVLGVAFEVYGALFWHVVSTFAVLLGCAAAVLAGLQLAERRRLAPAARFLTLAAPVEAAVLLIGNWRDQASRAYVQVVVTAAVLLLAGLVVSTLRLIADDDRGAAAALFRAVCTMTAAVVVLGLVFAWSGESPEGPGRALLGLIGAIVVLYAATPLLARFERRRH